jgi:hypothetical protein
MTLKQEYSYYGYDFGTSANDDITLGHDRIREHLWYDMQREVSSTNIARLFVFKSCKNVINALMDYKVNADTGKIDPTWKCIIDLLRYYFDIMDPWTHLSASENSQMSDDYDEIEAGRNPFRFKSVSEEEFVTTSGRW